MIVTEINAVRAIEAVMDGFRVMPMAEAAKIGDIFVTVTGNKSVLAGEHFEQMKDGAVICNSGHFNVEIDIPALEKMSSGNRIARPFVEEYSIKDGRRIYLLGEGRLINLAAAEGHPAAVMDMSFANQALSAEYMLKHSADLKPQVYTVPEAIDRQIAKLKLESMGVQMDKLTPEQELYLASWSEGTVRFSVRSASSVVNGFWRHRRRSARCLGGTIRMRNFLMLPIALGIFSISSFPRNHEFQNPSARRCVFPAR